MPYLIEIVSNTSGMGTLSLTLVVVLAIGAATVGSKAYPIDIIALFFPDAAILIFALSQNVCFSALQLVNL